VTDRRLRVPLHSLQLLLVSSAGAVSFAVTFAVTKELPGDGPIQHGVDSRDPQEYAAGVAPGGAHAPPH